MSWRCPACETQILHGGTEVAPQPGHGYRCHVCRLELVMDAHTNTLAPLPLALNLEPAARGVPNPIVPSSRPARKRR